MNRFLSQVVGVELFTPKINDSLWYFKDVLGYYEVGKDKESVYLRAYNEFLYPFSIKLTEQEKSGIGEIYVRTMSEADLYDTVKTLEGNGVKGLWVEPDSKIGRSYAFETPSGHTVRLFWDFKEFVTPEELKSILKDRPMKIPNKGIGVVGFDHVAVSGVNQKENRLFWEKLGVKTHEMVVKGNMEIAAFMSLTGKAHDIVFFNDQIPGRLNHVAINIEHSSDIFKVTDMYRDYGIEIVSGPLRHGITQGIGIYGKEPGGNVIEVHGLQYYNYLPDWKPLVWDVDKDFWNPGAALYGYISEYLMKGSPEPGVKPLRPIELRARR